MVLVRSVRICCFALLTIGLTTRVHAEDLVEFRNGAKVRGIVKEIRKDNREFDLEVQLGERTILRTFPFSKVHAVTMKGKRHVLNGLLPDAAGSVAQGAERVERTRREVLAMINTLGSSPPGWFDATPLRVPSTLDLSWPDAPEKVWQNQKYPGQYVWDVINPNRNKWREGIKLMHHLVARNQNNRSAQVKAMNQLGTLYASLMEDWPRAAFWWLQAGKGTAGAMGRGGFRVGYEVGLAKCYWKLGNKEMAAETLRRAEGSAAYLWAEMGEHDRALQVAEQAAKSWRGGGAYIICGDVCRHGGRYEQALQYYQQAADQEDTKKYARVIKDANERIAAMQAERAVDLSRTRNGTFQEESLGYSGMVQVAVSVRDHRVTNVKVTRHIEKQYYSSLTDIPHQIIRKQSVSGIDATAGAAITAEAIVRAAAKALASGVQKVSGRP